VNPPSDGPGGSSGPPDDRSSVESDRSSPSARLPPPAQTPSPAMNAQIERLQDGYTAGTRRLISNVVGGFRHIPVSANQVTAIGFGLNLVAAVLVYRELWIAAGLAFLVGSVLDIFDGAIARSKGEAGPRGALIDSTFDRIAEGVMLASIALVFARHDERIALVAVFAALVGSFLTSYIRARAEALGLDGTSGFMARAERVVLLGAALMFAPLGALPYGIELLAVLSAITVAQRLAYVLRQL
jgi:CDP-diacylglycerol--glycerol-3-phosphate 3-phosphatidyltransferase